MDSKIKQLLLLVESYHGSHRAPTPDDFNAPIHNLTQVYPDDIYGPRAVYLYGHHPEINQRNTLRIINQVRNNPNAKVTIYRAVPRDVTTINNGDWVAINKEYAKLHGDSHLDDYHIIEKEVYAYQLFNDGDSIEEYGYDSRTEKVNEAAQVIERDYFYHGSNDYFEPGTILTYRTDDRVWKKEQYNQILEQYRPSHVISRDRAVFLCDNEDDVNLIVGGAWLLTVEPLGPVSKHDANWIGELEYAIQNHANDEIERIAEAYWAGEPSPNEELWEYLCSSAEVIYVEEM